MAPAPMIQALHPRLVGGKAAWILLLRDAGALTYSPLDGGSLAVLVNRRIDRSFLFPFFFLTEKEKDETIKKDRPYKIFFKDLFLYKENEMAAKKRVR